MNLNEAQRRIRWILFIVLAGVAVLLTILDRTGNLDSALAFVRDPLATVIGWTSTQADEVAGVLNGPHDLESGHRPGYQPLFTQHYHRQRQRRWHCGGHAG
ncbi:MAG: hypothetical protein P8183_05940 [Anaerolineae bacterium]